MVCMVVQGDGPVQVAWYKDQEPLGHVPGVEAKMLDSMTSVLVFPSLTSQHSGRYVCEAQNDAGSAEAAASLSVNGRAAWRSR